MLTQVAPVTPPGEAIVSIEVIFGWRYGQATECPETSCNSCQPTTKTTSTTQPLQPRVRRYSPCVFYASNTKLVLFHGTSSPTQLTTTTTQFPPHHVADHFLSSSSCSSAHHEHHFPFNANPPPLALHLIYLQLPCHSSPVKSTLTNDTKPKNQAKPNQVVYRGSAGATAFRIIPNRPT